LPSSSPASRPKLGKSLTQIEVKGIDIMLVLDAWSMLTKILRLADRDDRVDVREVT
jgi:hypothetical protein